MIDLLYYSDHQVIKYIYPEFQIASNIEQISAVIQLPPFDKSEAQNYNFDLSLIINSEILTESEMQSLHCFIEELINNGLLIQSQKLNIIYKFIVDLQNNNQYTDICKTILFICDQMPSFQDKQIVMVRGIVKFSLICQLLVYLQTQNQYLQRYYYYGSPVLNHSTLQNILVQFVNQDFKCSGTASLYHPEIQYNLDINPIKTNVNKTQESSTQQTNILTHTIEQQIFKTEIQNQINFDHIDMTQIDLSELQLNQNQFEINVIQQEPIHPEQIETILEQETNTFVNNKTESSSSSEELIQVIKQDINDPTPLIQKISTELLVIEKSESDAYSVNSESVQAIQQAKLNDNSEPQQISNQESQEQQAQNQVNKNLFLTLEKYANQSEISKIQMQQYDYVEQFGSDDESSQSHKSEEKQQKLDQKEQNDTLKLHSQDRSPEISSSDEFSSVLVQQPELPVDTPTQQFKISEQSDIKNVQEPKQVCSEKLELKIQDYRKPNISRLNKQFSNNFNGSASNLTIQVDQMLNKLINNDTYQEYCYLSQQHQKIIQSTESQAGDKKIQQTPADCCEIKLIFIEEQMLIQQISKQTYISPKVNKRYQNCGICGENISLDDQIDMQRVQTNQENTDVYINVYSPKHYVQCCYFNSLFCSKCVQNQNFQELVPKLNSRVSVSSIALDDIYSGWNKIMVETPDSQQQLNYKKIIQSYALNIQCCRSLQNHLQRSESLIGIFTSIQQQNQTVLSQLNPFTRPQMQCFSQFKPSIDKLNKILDKQKNNVKQLLSVGNDKIENVAKFIVLHQIYCKKCQTIPKYCINCKSDIPLEISFEYVIQGKIQGFKCCCNCLKICHQTCLINGYCVDCK
ncbi:Conserved_hypothetical protein [Hexamita inflata]|uniref:Rubicon Homology domain-containing protein n=1 Tax=Hexamita inflata TaxID=28002 RepID=A0AA86UKR2_9EUKA|nr:Conserved hypothetical protein [Hexamita inflata]CAI9959559.1 Conserved hypothetical protein [Hexamita inflata]